MKLRTPSPVHEITGEQKTNGREKKYLSPSKASPNSEVVSPSHPAFLDDSPLFPLHFHLCSVFSFFLEKKNHLAKPKYRIRVHHLYGQILGFP